MIFFAKMLPNVQIVHWEGLEPSTTGLTGKMMISPDRDDFEQKTKILMF